MHWWTMQTSFTVSVISFIIYVSVSSHETDKTVHGHKDVAKTLGNGHVSCNCTCPYDTVYHVMLFSHYITNVHLRIVTLISLNMLQWVLHRK